MILIKEDLLQACCITLCQFYVACPNKLAGECMCHRSPFELVVRCFLIKYLRKGAINIILLLLGLVSWKLDDDRIILNYT